MQERYRKIYARTLRTRKRLLRLADDFPCAEDAYLWRDAAAEADRFLAAIRADDHTPLVLPATKFLADIEDFETAIEEIRFREGQRAFAPRPVAEVRA